MFSLETYQLCLKRKSASILLMFVLMATILDTIKCEGSHHKDSQINIEMLQQQQSSVDVQENDIRVLDRPVNEHKSHKQFNESLWKFGEAASVGNSPCNHASEDLDRCSAQIIAFGSSGMTFPQTMQELNSNYCPKMKQLSDCIKVSSGCYSRFERQVIRWVWV